MQFSTFPYRLVAAVALAAVAFLGATSLWAQSDYGLYVESVTTHDSGVLSGMTTYRLYMNMLNETDYLSSCSGDADSPLVLESSSGTWFNSEFNSSWNASGINPAFLGLFPELAFDSFLTIGAEDATAQASQHPSTVWGAINASEEFSGGEAGMNVTVNDATGGAWFTPYPGIELAGSHVGFAGTDLRVLVAQFTTSGTLSGQMTIQIFLNGNQADEYRELLTFATGVGVGCTDPAALNYDATAFVDDGTCEFDPNGCTDVTACNYDPNASVDDGSCQYLDACGVCGGNGEDVDGDGVCDDVDSCIGTPEECETPGCTDVTACNYNPEATSDDGSCEFNSCQWCDDPEACNFGEGTPWTANTDLCDYAAEGACDCDGNVLDAAGVCGGDCLVDEDGDGVCDDVDACVGVEDACGVCNGPGAEYECGCNDIPEGDCDCNGTQVDAVGVCGGNCALDADGDGWCDECFNTPVEGYALETDVVVEHTAGSLQGMTTYRVYVRCANPTDYVNACSGDNDNPLIISSSSGSWFNHALNSGFNAAGVNSALFGTYPNLVYDSYLTIGAESSDVPSSLHPGTIWGDINAADEFTGEGAGFNVTVDDNTGGAWYLPFPGVAEAETHPGFAGDDLRVLVMQVTTAGTLSGQIQLQIFQNADQTQEIREVFEFNSGSNETDCDNLDPCFGELDECGVCEGPGPVFECGCSVLPVGDCDCDGNQLDAAGVCGGNCFEDADGDGVCDVYSEGCTDPEACNYVVAQTDDGSCFYASPFYDCTGECIFDSDEDGVCDELEILGCTDATACNFDPSATEDDGECGQIDDCGVCGGIGYVGCIDAAACNYDSGASCDDGSCTYPELYYGCGGECLADDDADGICNELEVVGCQDETACNYDELATDEGGCEFAETFYDCDGMCLADADGDGVCDELEVVGCQDETACNYDELATDEGNCEYAEELYDCNGNCLNDADGDGICDELEVPGCSDAAACNYDEAATDDDGSCAFPGDACDDGDDTTINDALNEECECVGEVDGVEAAASRTWTIFPSPVRDVLNLRLEGGGWDGDVELMMLGATGQVLRSERLDGRTQLDVSDLASGIYFLTLRSPALATTTRRFIVTAGE